MLLMVFLLHGYGSLMFDACLPLGPCTTSKLILCPSLRDLKPFMRKQVFTFVIRSDEAESLRIVEPFDCTGCHDHLPLKKREHPRGTCCLHMLLFAIAAYS
jgi:hypothetical protein